MKRVKILPGCISCGTCAVICPEVFEVKNISVIKENVDFNKYSDKIEEAADMCPVSVIEIEK